MAKMKGGEELYKMYKYDKKVEPDVNENDSKGTSFNTDTERMKQTSKKSLDVEVDEYSCYNICQLGLGVTGVYFACCPRTKVNNILL